MLKSSYIQQSKIAKRDAQLDDHQLQSCSANLHSEHLVCTYDGGYYLRNLDREVSHCTLLSLLEWLLHS